VIILGIETSSIVCSVGLADDHGWRLERHLANPHIHSEKILTLIAEMLQSAKMEISDLDAVAVSSGPGSFTGLRIGLSTAKGLCYSLDVPLVCVPTFEAAAEAFAEREPTYSQFNIAVDAKQGDYYVASFVRTAAGIQELIQTHTRRLDNLLLSDRSNSPVLWITDRADDIQNLSQTPLEIRSFTDYCRGDSVAAIGMTKCHTNAFADLASAEPMYLKEFLVKTATT
jgi:tRNA threonylcarbamoyladenosine biosynthesis protein TsaB